MFGCCVTTACLSLEERDKVGKESGNNKCVGGVPPIATATNALNSLK